LVEKKKTATIVKQLKGIKHLVLGNHDKWKTSVYQEMGFKTVHTAFMLDNSEWWPDVTRPWLLVHDLVEQLCVGHLPVLCGHTHNLLSVIGSAINVGVDVLKVVLIMKSYEVNFCNFT